MRWVLLVLLVVFPGPPIQAEERETPNLTVEIIRSSMEVSEPLAQTVLDQLKESPGHSARASLSGGVGNLALLQRVGYLKDYEADNLEEPKPIRAFLREGVLLDVVSATTSEGGALTLDLRLTFAEMVRPIPSFTTTMGAKKVTIELPELQIRRVRKEVLVTGGRPTAFPVGSVTTDGGGREHLYVAVSVGSGNGEEAILPSSRKK